MEMVFKVCVNIIIITDAIIIAVTDSKISKIFGVLSIIFMCISLL